MGDSLLNSRLGERPPCRDKALDLLARRPHFQAELEAKLRKREYDDEEISSTMRRLLEERFVDDAETAKAFVESRLRRGPIGSTKLRAQLFRRGVDADHVEAALRLIDREAEMAGALEAAERFRARSGDDVDREALGRHLERKGFGTRIILDILEG